MSQRRSEGMVPKLLRRARDVTEDDTVGLNIDDKSSFEKKYKDIGISKNETKILAQQSFPGGGV